MLKMRVIPINKTKWETKMVEENKTESVEEPTIKFADDGKEHKINEMPDNAKELYLLWQEEKQIEMIYCNANKSIES